MSATSRAEIGSRGFALRSCREYGNQRDDRRDPLRRRELRRLDHQQQLHQVLVDGRAAGLHEEDVGAADRLVVAAVRLVVRERLERRPRRARRRAARRSVCASSGCERPEKTISRFRGPRSIQCPGCGSARPPVPSRPGSGQLSRPGFHACHRHPPCRPGAARTRERAGRDVFRDHRTRRNPRVVADLDRSNERIVDAGPDVAADRRPAFGCPGSCVKFAVMLPARDVRVLADVGVADVGEVRHLRARADVREFLISTKVPDLRARCRGPCRGEGNRTARRSHRPDRRRRDGVRADLGARRPSCPGGP